MRAESVTKRHHRVRERVVLLLGGALYALFYARGSQIDERGATTPGASLARFAMALPVACLALYALLRFALPRLELAGDTGEKRPFCTPGAFGLILASYVPLFLIEYPGSFMYDIAAQATQIATGRYSMFHPLAHTLLLRACLGLSDVLGSLERCAALYSVISMTAMAACFALVCASLARSVSRRAARLSVGFFCLYPAHMAMASNCTKDGLFAACFALYLALCAEDLACGRLSRGHRVLQVLAGTAACLLRNNMIYAIAVYTVLLFAGGKRTLRVALCALLAIALSRAANAGLGAMVQADAGSMGEMLSVPIQQLARARLTCGEVFTPEERELMDEVCAHPTYDYTQVWRDYEPTLSDPVKNFLNPDVMRERMPELAAMWLRVGRECPNVYLDAFLALALPSYYPYSEYRVAQPDLEIGMQPGALTAPFGLEPIVQPGRFEALRTWLYENVYRTGMDDVPVLRLTMNTGAVYWLLLLLALYDLFCGRWERIAFMLLAGLLWGTFLLGPVMQGRYLYPFVCVLPLFAMRRKTIQREMKQEEPTHGV